MVIIKAKENDVIKYWTHEYRYDYEAMGMSYLNKNLRESLATMTDMEIIRCPSKPLFYSQVGEWKTRDEILEDMTTYFRKKLKSINSNSYYKKYKTSKRKHIQYFTNRLRFWKYLKEKG